MLLLSLVTFTAHRGAMIMKLKQLPVLKVFELMWVIVFGDGARLDSRDMRRDSLKPSTGTLPMVLRVSSLD